MAIKLDEAKIRHLSTNGTTTIAGGHIYLTGAQAGSSTGNTTQIVFGTANDNHVALSSNSNAFIINPTTSSTTNQIVLYLNQKSKFPSGIDAGTGGITTTGNISGNYIQGTWLYTSAATAQTTTSKIAVIHTDGYIYYITPANLTTLIKNNASGTWSISVSGNAATSTAATKLSSNNSFALGEHRFQYFNINGTAGAAKEVNDTPTTTWWHIMRLTHANTTGYYTDVAIPFNDNSIYYKRIKAGVVQDWVKVLDSLNYSSYALPITGGTLTSSLTIADGADLYLKAGSSNTTDSGDLVFINNDGTENMRIYGAGNIRFSASGPTYTLLHSGNYNNYAPSKTGSGASGNWGINITGSAAKLTTPRAINGTNFDGSAAITTAYWGTARNFTIGNTTKSVNGSSAISWSFKEIGLSKDYTSFGTASSNSWGWYTIATISDASTSPALFFVRAYAHSSIIFTVTKGYSTSGSLNILDYNSSANQDYAAVTGARLMSDGRIQIYIRTKKTTNTSQNAIMDLSINVINSGNNITLASSLVADDTASPSVIITRNCTTTGGMIAAAFDGNATSATVTATLGKSGGTTGPMKFYWSGQSGQPSWLWGGNDGTNMYVYNPSNFSVNYATSAGSATKLGTSTVGATDRPIYLSSGTATQTTYRMAATNASATSALAITSDLPTGIWYVSGTSEILGHSDGVVIANQYNSSWITEIYQDYRTGQLAVRGKNSGTWQAWRKILDSTNYSSYALPLAGGTMNAGAQILRASSSQSWVNGRKGALLAHAYASANRFTNNQYNPLWSAKSINGSWDCGTYTANNSLYFTYITDTNFDAGTNTTTHQVIISGNDGRITASGFVGPLSGNATSASNFNSARTIALTGAVTGSASSNGASGWSIAATIAEKQITPTDITTTFRTQTKGDANLGAYLSVIRSESADSSGYMPQHGSGIAFGRQDTQTYLYTNYSSAYAYIGGGNGNKLNWVKRIAFTDGTGASGNWNINAATATNADTTDGLHVHTGRNNEANKIVRTDGNGYIQCGYINCSSGNEGNNSSPPRVWGTNGSDNFLRTYLTSALSVGYAASAGAVAWANVTGKPSTFTPASHTHNYAGSGSAGGAANSANVLNINNTASLSNCLQYIQTSSQTTGNDLPDANWHHVLKMSHGTGDTYYKRLVAFDFWGQNAVYTTTAEGDGVVKAWKKFWIEGDSVTGAVWNDYAEYRESDCKEFGRVLAEKGDDTLTQTIERLQPFAGVSSDTWGFCQGETEKAKTPIAVAGRVLVYTYRDRKEYKPGDVVCAAPNGTVDIMTREEIITYPDRIVGTVSCVPEYETWGSGDRDPVKVNNRIWIKVN